MYTRALLRITKTRVTSFCTDTTQCWEANDNHDTYCKSTLLFLQFSKRQLFISFIQVEIYLNCVLVTEFALIVKKQTYKPLIAKCVNFW